MTTDEILREFDLRWLMNSEHLANSERAQLRALADALRVAREREARVPKEPSPLRLHAERELNAIGETSPMREHLLHMVDVFSAEDHSGFSASFAASALDKLLRFEPLTPLTGDDSEWMEVGDGLWQNIRCSHVFKSIDDGAYDIDGRVFRDPDGCRYTNGKSHTPVTFPYTPTRVYVDVDVDGNALDAATTGGSL
jgi:hypothetical protein